VKAPASEVFVVLADVPKSASYFPNVDRLVDLGNNTYRWEMEKIGLPQVNIQTIYACKYIADQVKGTVAWTPIKDVGNALVSGKWKIADAKASTRLTLRIKGVLTVPLPGLMQMLIAPVVKHEFENLIEKYLKNLTKRFGGAA
jgi:carbon monoxide dehydrogenase subunit G